MNLRRKLRRIMRTRIKVRNTRRRERACAMILAIVTLFHATHAYGALIHEVTNEPVIAPVRAQTAGTGHLTRPAVKTAREAHSRQPAEVLRAFLADKNPELAAHADHIVTLPRWVEAIAITHKETSYCTRGVGASRNNCGAIKNLSGEFKHYKNRLNAVEDIAILLQKERYKNLTIEEMNGIYCQDASRPGRKCLNWDRDIMRVVDELNGKLLGV